MGGGGSKVGTELDDDDDLPKETEADKQDPDNKCLVVEPDFGGPCKKRRCTDCLCLLLHILVGGFAPDCFRETTNHTHSFPQVLGDYTRSPTSLASETYRILLCLHVRARNWE